eukprot:Rhum_TRINITY_DN15042_c14_g1::Rhum_TRINITY_DN15042_c14_g1_i1::g.137137::m.137137
MCEVRKKNRLNQTPPSLPPYLPPSLPAFLSLAYWSYYCFDTLYTSPFTPSYPLLCSADETLRSPCSLYPTSLHHLSLSLALSLCLSFSLSHLSPSLSLSYPPPPSHSFFPALSFLPVFLFYVTVHIPCFFHQRALKKRQAKQKKKKKKKTKSKQNTNQAQQRCVAKKYFFDKQKKILATIPPPPPNKATPTLPFCSRCRYIVFLCHTDIPPPSLLSLSLLPLNPHRSPLPSPAFLPFLLPPTRPYLSFFFRQKKILLFCYLRPPLSTLNPEAKKPFTFFLLFFFLLLSPKKKGRGGGEGGFFVPLQKGRLFPLPSPHQAYSPAPPPSHLS